MSSIMHEHEVVDQCDPSGAPLEIAKETLKRATPQFFSTKSAFCHSTNPVER